MDLDGVRTFVVAAELGQFQAVADELGITPQAVSKRVATLERDVGTTLFTRLAHGVELTGQGRNFLPHARELLHAADRARRAARPVGRALRVDVTHRRIAPSVVLQDFHLAHPDLEIDVVAPLDNTLPGAVAAVQSGAVDASFRAVTLAAADVPHSVSVARALDHELELLVGPQHPLAHETIVAPAELAAHRIWIPGIVAGSEWAQFYRDFATTFGLTIDARGPHFGDEALLERLRHDGTIATVVGQRDRYLWPAEYGLRRIPLRDPTPIYPHSLLWLTANHHPALGLLRKHLAAQRATHWAEPPVWAPAWAATGCTCSLT